MSSSSSSSSRICIAPITKKEHRCCLKKNGRWIFFCNSKHIEPIIIILAHNVLKLCSKYIRNFSPFHSGIATLPQNTLAIKWTPLTLYSFGWVFVKRSWRMRSNDYFQYSLSQKFSPRCRPPSLAISSWLNFGRPAPWEGGLRRGEIFWLHLTTASAQCLRLSERFFHCHLVILTCSDGDRLDLFYRTAAAAVQLLHLVFLKPHVFPEIILRWAVSLEGLLKRTFENCWCVIFIGWMPFLSPN